MKNRDFFLPSITTMILCGLVWFLSCAHQNRYRQDIQETEGFETFASSDQEPESDPEQFGEAGSDESFDFESEKSFSEGPEEFASNKDAGVSESSDFSEESAFFDEPAEESTDKASSDTLESGNATATEEASPPLAETTPQAIEQESETETVEPILEEIAPAPKPAWIARTPQVPTDSFTKKGAVLNRFYFARKGDSPKKISQLIYGDFSHSKKLSTWNGKNWSAGKILFYASPQDPSDKKMRSFYQENQIEPKEYRVKRGDWLSSIAKRTLGDTRSWKELAVVNGLDSPNDLESGQVLAIYPKSLKSMEPKEETSFAAVTSPEQQTEVQPAPITQEPEIAQAAEQAVPMPAQPQETIPPQQTTAPSFANPPPIQEPQVEEPIETDAVRSSSDLNWDQLIEQNFVAILTGAALIILLLALSARKKRLKAKSSSDEDTGSEPKSRFGRR